MYKALSLVLDPSNLTEVMATFLNSAPVAWLSIILLYCSPTSGVFSLSRCPPASSFPPPSWNELILCLAVLALPGIWGSQWLRRGNKKGPGVSAIWPLRHWCAATKMRRRVVLVSSSCFFFRRREGRLGRQACTKGLVICKYVTRLHLHTYVPTN